MRLKEKNQAVLLLERKRVAICQREFVKFPADMHGDDVEIVLKHRPGKATEQIHHERTTAG